ncbi:MMPL family transporter [bacterium]|nr:MMPL family transporter [candidate division CSSED10-310 bacterium]
MNRLILTQFSLKHPRLTIGIVIVLTILAASQFPRVHFDNDPENMLSKDEFVRVFHHDTQKKFGLYDFVIVGIVNDTHPDGIFNVETLRRVDTLTYQLLSLQKSPDGKPMITMGRPGAEQVTLDLHPDSLFRRFLNIVFRHDPNRLFSDTGESAIVARELMSPSVVDNIKQAGMGSLKLEYLMERVPETQEQALSIRDDAMNNPLFNGTLVSEDGQAVCIYIPITDKTFSYTIASLVQKLTAPWAGSDDKIYIAGLPVAEDTFGVEMLVQMATSAPLAMIILFAIMLLFFRRVSLIIAPLLLSAIAVVWTMGLLIGLGFDVHIMSSMIPIFIMPITVCNSIHVLSEFFDSYRRFEDKVRGLKHVMHELFAPILFATTTTIAGFASLATTPIPPVRVFGLHVAFGVAAGWLLTLTFVPAFISLFISDASLKRLCADSGSGENCKVSADPMGRMLRWMGHMTYRRSSTIIVITLLTLGLSIYGMTLIRVNDNPVKWFTSTHPLRVADTVLNDHFGGTYTAYLTLAGEPTAATTCREEAAVIRRLAMERFGTVMPEAAGRFVGELNRIQQNFSSAGTSDPNRCFVDLVQSAEAIDREYTASWSTLADAINYLAIDGLTYETLTATVSDMDTVRAADKEIFLDRLKPDAALTGAELLDRALAITDAFTALSFEDFVYDVKSEITAPLFKRPDMLAYIERLQTHLNTLPTVGKTTSAVDALKKANYELNYQEPVRDESDTERTAGMERNQSFYRIPDSASGTGQVYIQLEGMKKKDSIFHMVSRDYQEANVWVQLTSGDNQDMSGVVDDVDAFVAGNPPPVPLKVRWAGLTYLNVVWQEKMVVGMMSSLISSYIVVLIMMLLLFRSGWFGFLSMIPLTVTIAFIYGLIGWIGKDYDMPVAILSAMTLGLSVDFAIHFLERSREIFKRTGNWPATSEAMFNEPAKAISRNAIVIALGFTPLLLAPLVPYRTVGFFLAMIMLLSWLATVMILPALIRKLDKRMFREIDQAVESTEPMPSTNPRLSATPKNLMNPMNPDHLR